MTFQLLLFVHFISVLLMVGIIWFVQIVHYPLMADVGQEGFRRYSQRHIERTQWVVSGPMLMEALTAAAMLAWYPLHLLSPILMVAEVMLLVVWLSTACLQLPLHWRLTQGFDHQRLQKLVRSNWIRTIAWTARAVLVGFVLISDAPTWLASL